METTLTRPAVARDSATAGIVPGEFDQIVRLHQQKIYRVLLVLLRDPDAADTLTQECFLRAYKNWANFRGKSSLQTWLLSIAVNLARDHRKNRRLTFWRGLKRDGGSGEVEAALKKTQEPYASPERTLLAREELSTVWTAVDHLPPKQRTIFLLRFAEEMSLEEISEAMKLGVGTVKSHLFRALRTVRKRLRE